MGSNDRSAGASIPEVFFRSSGSFPRGFLTSIPKAINVARHASNQARPAPLLDHPSDDIRLEAVSALVYHFKLDAYVPKAMAMLVDDRSEYVRGTAALSIGMYALRTEHRRD